MKPQDVSTNNFLEVGAAALLVGDLEARMKGKPWGTFGTADMPFLDQLLQPSLLTTVTNSAAARAHLKAITALKRSKPGPQQIWHVLLTPWTLLLHTFLSCHDYIFDWSTWADNYSSSIAYYQLMTYVLVLVLDFKSFLAEYFQCRELFPSLLDVSFCIAYEELT